MAFFGTADPRYSWVMLHRVGHRDPIHESPPAELAVRARVIPLPYRTAFGRIGRWVLYQTVSFGYTGGYASNTRETP